jgi:predicted nuclease with TOPRIM domain
MPVGDLDHIGCFADQVKLTRALVRDLDEAVKEVNLLGEHEKESSQKITELEALCKRLREDAQRLREERTTLKGMIQSRDELILEMAEEYELNHMGENNDDEDEDDDNEGNTVTPQHRRSLSCLRSSKKKTPWRMVHRSWMIWMTWVIWMRI